MALKTERRPYVPRADRLQMPRSAGVPEGGLYEIVLVSGAASCAAAIWYGVTPDPDFPDNMQDRSAYWHGEINGEPDPNPCCAPSERVWRIWHCRDLVRVTPRRYKWLIEHRAWAKRHRPDSPEANPWRRPDPLKTRVPF